jgi:hypothetical protein
MNHHESDSSIEPYFQSNERRRELLDRFTDIALTRDIFPAYVRACDRTIKQDGRLDSAHVSGLAVARHAELPLYPVAEYVSDPHGKGYHIKLARYDPDTLETVEESDVLVATYITEFLGNRIEHMGVIVPVFTEDQAVLVKEHALSLVSDEIESPTF